MKRDESSSEEPPGMPMLTKKSVKGKMVRIVSKSETESLGFFVEEIENE
jgi:hypothetical protein